MNIILDSKTLGLCEANHSIFAHEGADFLLFLSSFGLPSIFSDVVVKFSDVDKPSKYASLSIDEIKKMLNDLITIGHGWPSSDYLNSKERKEREKDLKECVDHFPMNFNNSTFSEELMGLWDASYNDIRSVVDDITSLLGEPSDSLTLGEYMYNFGHPEIVLYVNALKKESAYRKDNIDNTYKRVLYHELFHAYHYAAAQTNGELDEFIIRRDYKREVVLESLAAYVEQLFCKRFALNTDLVTAWDQYNVINYPYSGARKIENTNHFKNVFDLSIYDIDQALRVLYRNDSDEFYTIINAKPLIIRKEIVKKVVPILIKGPSCTPTIPSLDIERLIDSCGSGWLVLRLYTKYVCSSYNEWNNPSDVGLSARINSFKRIESYELHLIRFLNHILYNAKTSVTYHAETRVVPLDEFKIKAEEILKVIA